MKEKGLYVMNTKKGAFLKTPSKKAQESQNSKNY